ncbi:hypothetical protein BSKO_12144 [Bryopsis sp. KO-2023]|nr:hypothetical protein BSKO_12144 [Bryopsis sp. KO-2023]
MEFKAMMTEIGVLAAISLLAVAICIRRCFRNTPTMPLCSQPPQKSEDVEVVVVTNDELWSIGVVPTATEPTIEPSHHVSVQVDPESTSFPALPVEPVPSMDQQPPPTPPSSGKAEVEKIPVVCGVAADIGGRRSMEDAHLVVFDQACQGGSSTMRSLESLMAMGAARALPLWRQSFQLFWRKKRQAVIKKLSSEHLKGATGRCGGYLTKTPAPWRKAGLQRWWRRW